MPALSFYRCWKILKLDSLKNADEMYNSWYNYITKYIGPECKNIQKQLLHSEKELNLFFNNFALKLGAMKNQFALEI